MHARSEAAKEIEALITVSRAIPRDAGRLFGPGPQGWWDSEVLSYPHVLHDSDGSWKMWYYGHDATFDRLVHLPSGRVGMAVSRDGIRWERFRGPMAMGAVFDPAASTSDRFDNAHVGISDVYVDSGLYWMWYAGGDQTMVEFPDAVRGRTRTKGLSMRPGCAVSRDGINWTRLAGPYQGAFLDVSHDGWDSFFVSWPRVVKDVSDYKMYYHTFDRARGFFVVGMAISDDGFRWNKLGQVLGPGAPGSFDEGGIGCRHVLKIGAEYAMFYEGKGPGGYYSIGLALSQDGIRWQKDESGQAPGGPVFTHAPEGSGRWDTGIVGTPCVVCVPDGSYRMYYVGCDEGWAHGLVSRLAIGMAISDGPDFRRWRRWNG